MVRVGTDGRVPVGGQAMRLEVASGTRVVLCHHPSGHHSVLAQQRDPKIKPVMLFASRPT